LSFGLPGTDCHEGLGHPWQVPFTISPLDGDGVPVAQPLGPPPPATVLRRSEPRRGALHRLAEPYVEL
jgi:hypothetical protein